jgi:hypothetical protein
MWPLLPLNCLKHGIIQFRVEPVTKINDVTKAVGTKVIFAAAA